MFICRYLSYAPPAYEYGTRPFLNWVLSQGRSPTRQAVPKMPRTPSAFPFSGRLRRRAINPTPPKRVKAWGDGPLRPEVMYPVVEHTRPNCAARNHSRSRAPHHRTQRNVHMPLNNRPPPQQILNICPRDINVIILLKIRTLNMLLWTFLFCTSVLCSCYFIKTFIAILTTFSKKFKFPKKVIITETLNVDFHYKFIVFWINLLEIGLFWPLTTLLC